MSSDPSPPAGGLRYRDAGVDIDRGNRLVEAIKPLARATARPEVLGGIGGFGALMRVPVERYREPVLVAGTDGVGTKLKLALETGLHRGVGVDLVAMCVNDILTLGAEPFLFLDYLATSRLDEAVAIEVIAGIADGCREAGAALIGGETAEMPGMYADRDYDLAGFCVGLVERDDIIDGTRIRAGDALLGLASSGPHSNGYSLVRAVLARSSASLGHRLSDGRTLAEALMAPTRIYAGPLARLREAVPVNGLAHVTGGGLTENVPRMLPPGTGAALSPGEWPRGAVFDWLQEAGGIAEDEMRRTFNCGVGMVACVPADRAREALDALRKAGETAWQVGSVVEDPHAGVRYLP